MAAINVLTVTYFLAIENYPVLQAIFPTFGHYIAIVVGTGVPLLVLVGYFHYKRSQAYAAEADINIEANPYWYKIPPGWNKEVVFPLYLNMINLMLKMSKNEKLAPDEIEKMLDIQKSLSNLIDGGYVGKPFRMKDD
tara:strand:+ start:487 stop:897 length:411 start_codon:yes stop_codon:yes gene_type:complete